MLTEKINTDIFGRSRLLDLEKEQAGMTNDPLTQMLVDGVDYRAAELGEGFNTTVNASLNAAFAGAAVVAGAGVAMVGMARDLMTPANDVTGISTHLSGAALEEIGRIRMAHANVFGGADLNESALLGQAMPTYVPALNGFAVGQNIR